MSLTPNALSPVAAIGLLVLVASGCAGAVDVEPAPGATEQACTDLVEALPATVADLPRRGTSGTAGIAAWGDPAVVLRCGTDPLGPTTQPCVSADGVDWVRAVEDTESGAALFVAYGRVPGIDVEVPGAWVAADVLPDLADAVGELPQERTCL